MTNFWLGELIKIVMLFGSAYLLGLWVVKRGIRVNYTRKIFHFILFFLPFFLYRVLPYQASVTTFLASGLLFLLCIGTFIRPLRSRSAFLGTAFACFDRPEDRPFTLLWLSTQVAAGYAALMLVAFWLAEYSQQSLIFIAMFVAGVGDGLAEPVGVRFGKHRYHVRALFTDRRYTRSLEGSACVFLSAVAAIFLLRSNLTEVQFWLALATVPVAVTLAEALSPHTWDTPFLYLAGGGSVVGVLELSRLLS